MLDLRFIQTIIVLFFAWARLFLNEEALHADGFFLLFVAGEARDIDATAL